MKPPLTILLPASRANRLTTDPLTGQPVCACRGRVAECPAPRPRMHLRFSRVPANGQYWSFLALGVEPFGPCSVGIRSRLMQS